MLQSSLFGARFAEATPLGSEAVRKLAVPIPHADLPETPSVTWEEKAVRLSEKRVTLGKRGQVSQNGSGKPKGVKLAKKGSGQGKKSQVR